MGGEVGANIQKIFSYGHRNGFGMAFDPYSGHLWETENGDDAFSELNRVEAGMNGGWIQIGGPAASLLRLQGHRGQRVRPEPAAGALPADPPGGVARRGARDDLFMLPGAKYVDPELSWKYESGPAGTTFVHGNGARRRVTTARCGSGPRARSSRSAARAAACSGCSSPRNRKKVDVADPQLAERVADNLTKFGPTESESLMIGTGFGTTPSIEQGPDGNLYVVSITDGAIYMISHK